MKKYLFTLSALVFFAGSVIAQDAFKLIHVADLSAMRDQKAPKLVVLDVNNEKTRLRFGVIPDARLLSSYDKFDVAKELPADKSAKLVFYCADTL